MADSMSQLPRDRAVTVNWAVFRSLTSRALNDSDYPWKNSVYVIGDSAGRPLYVGKATGKKFRGFGERYWGDLQAIRAWGHGARNRLYIGIIRGARRAWYHDLERELVALEASSTRRTAPRYNNQYKDTKPDMALRLVHKGDAPRFYYLSPPKRRNTS